MKNTKIILLVLLCINLFLIAGCSKKEKLVIVNDEEVCQKISGNWYRTLRLESVVYTDPEDVSSNVANISFISNTILTLNGDNSFSMSIDQKLEAFSPIVENCPYTEDQIADNVNGFMQLEGSFIADSSYIKLSYKDPKDGPVDQLAQWTIDNEVFILGDPASDDRIEYRRTPQLVK